VSLAICKEAHNYRDLTITDFSTPNPNPNPIGCDLPMSVRLNLTPSWFLQILRTNESVSIGVFPTLFPLVGTLITEDLTRHRYDLLKRLNTLRVDRKIHSVWTHDGSELVKETERSRPLVVKSRQDSVWLSFQ
jgi:hypothetical protein